MKARIEKSIFFLWSLRREFAKYFIIGLFSLALDYGFFLLLFKIAHLWYLFSSATSQLIGGIFNFIMNRNWSFRAKNNSTQKQFTRYLTLQIFNYTFGIVSLYIFVDYLNLIPQLGKILTITIMVCWNFFLYKFFVYKKEEPDGSS